MSATDAAATEATLVGRCYTKARKHQVLVGRIPGGGRLWGGPYSVPQLAVMACAFVLLLLTRPAWAHFGMLNLLLPVVVPYVLGLVVRRLQVDGRSPLAVVGSIAVLLLTPSTGRVGGRPVRTVRLRQVAGAVSLPPHPGRGETPRRPPAVGDALAGGPKVMSGAQALLARRRAEAERGNS
ncbi:hypothetical protein [Streptomyces sp. SM12]|uniref:hypothetical protein n=1 Tax=Streptomyces sp. SM12 TaxID=1071602 RepID=UPI0011B0CE77|nr:hypothetical protein [Streptomyces sp. SM12]